MIEALKKYKEVTVAAIFFLGIAGFFVKPRAEQFIQQSVDARFKTVSEQIAALQKILDDDKIDKLTTQSDLISVKALLKQLLELQLRERNRQP